MMKIKFQSILLLFYAILTVTGGIMGYVKAASLPSLIMGAIFGTLIFISSIGVHLEKNWGRYLAIGLASILLVFFGYRFMSSLKFMPAGLMVLASIGVLLSFFKR